MQYRHRRATALLAAVFVALGTLAITATPAHATGLIKCDVLPNGAEDNDGDVAIFVGPFDPIVFHNVETSDPSEAQPHQHDFFGNRRVISAGQVEYLNEIHWDEMRAFAGGGGFDATSCRIFEDTAAYWAPSLVYTSGPKAGQRVGVRQFSAYYRGFAGQTTHAGSQAIPAGARLVASQSSTAGGGPGFGLSGWTCGQNSTVTGGQATIPNCVGSGGGPGDSLTAHINFPSCWNGVAPNHAGDPGREGQFDIPPDPYVYGDTRDNNYGVAGAHTSNDFKYPANKTACPTSHPIEVVQLRETVAYDYVGNGSDVALTSDIHNGVVTQPRGSTMHVDFWNTWDQPKFVDFVQRCIKTAEEPNCKP